jgi:hypothetical protein
MTLATPEFTMSSRDTWMSGVGAVVGSRLMREPVTSTSCSA